MTDVRPIEGYVVAPDAAEEVVAPPYDALTPEERAEHVRAHPDSFLAVLPEAEYTPEPEFDRARQRLHELIRDGVFVRRDRPFFGVYRLAEGDHAQIGLVCDLPVEAIRAGRVHPHEHTRPDRVADIARFLDELGVASSPVSLAFRGAHRLRESMRAETARPPDVALTGWDVEQQLWVVEDVEPLLEAARDIGDLYITDGHHRTAAALAHADGAGRDDEAAQALLTVLFPAEELRLVDFHRIVDEPEVPARELVAILREAGWTATTEAAPSLPASPGEVLIVDRAHAHRVELPPPDPGRPDAGQRVAQLDAVRLQEEVLGAILGIDDPRDHPQLRFIPGGRGVGPLLEAVRGTDAIGFAVHPPSVDDLVAVADAGEVMPPKSTYFTPKVRSGLLLRFRR